MNISIPISCEIDSVSFSFYSPLQLKKLSVKEITNPILFDNLDHPTAGGLYDPALGPTDRQARYFF
jgi:DNA-directed RNA polymerase I subunit RPA1